MHTRSGCRSNEVRPPRKGAVVGEVLPGLLTARAPGWSGGPAALARQPPAHPASISITIGMATATGNGKTTGKWWTRARERQSTPRGFWAPFYRFPFGVRHKVKLLGMQGCGIRIQPWSVIWQNPHVWFFFFFPKELSPGSQRCLRAELENRHVASALPKNCPWPRLHSAPMR